MSNSEGETNIQDFQAQLKTMTWDELKMLLKELTIGEYYEMCAMVQHEIDERVKDVKV